jgi:hypothetical protein
MNKKSLILILFLFNFAYFQDSNDEKLKCNTNTKILDNEDNQNADYCNKIAIETKEGKCCYVKANLYGKRFNFCKYVFNYKETKKKLNEIGYKHVDIDCYVKYLEKLNKILLLTFILNI